MAIYKICTHCKGEVRNPCREKSSPENGQIVYVAADWELRRIGYFQRLACAYWRKRISRRKTPDWLANVIFGFEGRILWPDDAPFCTPDELVDDVFPHVNATRWFSDFRAFCHRRPRQRPHRNKLAALRLIDLALKIEALKR